MNDIHIRTNVGGLRPGDIVIDSWVEKRIQMVLSVTNNMYIVWLMGERVWSEKHDNNSYGRVFYVLFRNNEC